MKGGCLAFGWGKGSYGLSPRPFERQLLRLPRQTTIKGRRAKMFDCVCRLPKFLIFCFSVVGASRVGLPLLLSDMGSLKRRGYHDGTG